MARGKRAIGNPDGTPRLELADADASDDLIIAAIKQAEAEESQAAAGAAADADGIFPTEARSPQSNGSPFEAQEVAPVRPPEQVYVSPKEAKRQAQESAKWLLMIIEGAAVVSLGNDARLMPEERKMILEPLERIMARLSPAFNEQLQKWTDPILLLFGLSTWGLRLYTIAQEKGNDDEGKRKPPPEVEPKPPSGNGRTVEEVLAEDTAVLRAGPDQRIISQVQTTGFGGQP